MLEETILREIAMQPNATDEELARQMDIKPRRVQKVRAKRRGTYFIGDEQGRVKIGKSKDIAARLQKMQTDNADNLTVLGVLDCNECELHVKFAHYHVRGEWFVLSEEIKQYIENLE